MNTDAENLPPDRIGEESRIVLGQFLRDFNEAMPRGDDLRSSWDSFLGFLSAEYARKKLLSRFRDWLILPKRLFERGDGRAIKLGWYAKKAGMMPRWWPRERLQPLGIETREERKERQQTPRVPAPACWLKDCDRSRRWTDHCRSECVLKFLDRHRFTLSEIKASLECGDCRSGFDYCYDDKIDSGGDNTVSMDDSRPKAAEERRKRAEAFADAQVSDEKLPDLVRELIASPHEDSPHEEPRKGIRWNDLIPEVRLGILGGAAAVAVCLAILLAVTKLPGPSATRLTLASATGRDPGASTQQQQLLSLFEEPLALSFDAKRREIEFPLTAGGSQKVALVDSPEATTTFGSTLSGTNRATLGGREVTWIVELQLRPTLARIDAGDPVIDATLDILIKDGTATVLRRLSWRRL